jgi:hypothetical protein
MIEVVKNIPRPISAAFVHEWCFVYKKRIGLIRRNHSAILSTAWELEGIFNFLYPTWVDSPNEN